VEVLSTNNYKTQTTNETKLRLHARLRKNVKYNTTKRPNTILHNSTMRLGSDGATDSTDQ